MIIKPVFIILILGFPWFVQAGQVGGNDAEFMADRQPQIACSRSLASKNLARARFLCELTQALGLRPTKNTPQRRALRACRSRAS